MRVFPDLNPEFDHWTHQCPECQRILQENWWDLNCREQCFRYQVLKAAGEATRRKFWRLYLVLVGCLIFSNFYRVIERLWWG